MAPMKNLIVSRIVKVCLATIVVITVSVGCAEDVVEPMGDDCTGTKYTYTTEIKMIMDTNCASSGCHNGENSLSDYSTYQGVYKDRSKLKNGITIGIEQVTGGRARLTSAEQQMLWCWINAGAPE